MRLQSAEDRARSIADRLLAHVWREREGERESGRERQREIEREGDKERDIEGHREGGDGGR